MYLQRKYHQIFTSALRAPGIEVLRLIKSQLMPCLGSGSTPRPDLTDYQVADQRSVSDYQGGGLLESAPELAAGYRPGSMHLKCYPLIPQGVKVLEC